jgi:predicted RNase H-like nuclease
MTVGHYFTKLYATTCHFDPHPEVGVDVPIGLYDFCAGERPQSGLIGATFNARLVSMRQSFVGACHPEAGRQLHEPL